MERVPVRRIDVRRAVLGALLGSDRALSAAELARGLGIVGDTATGRSGRKVIADLLAYQCRLGRIRRVGRGRYIAVPSAMSRAMRWRCDNWESISPHPKRPAPGNATHQT
jgi:hypothetical protein